MKCIVGLLITIVTYNGIFGVQQKVDQSFKFGVENIKDSVWERMQSNQQRKIAIGLITNQTGKDQSGKRTIDILLDRGWLVKRIFVPEHGLDGSIPAEKEVKDMIDAATNIPVVSLYGKGTGKRMNPHHIKDLSLLVFDMQDSGMRHFTYVSTLFHILEAAAHYDKPLVILDRPNPLGSRMEGPLTDPNSKSFIAVAPMPLRHGLTIGELAHYFNKHVLRKQARVHVVRMEHFSRAKGFMAKKFIPLSPNLSTKNACMCYSFLGLLGEVRPIDTGLGTPYAMECIALSESVKISDTFWPTMQASLKKLGIDSAVCRYYSTRRKQYCKGLHFNVQDIDKVASFDILITILQSLHKANIQLTFSKLFDVAVGSKKVQGYVKGAISKKELQQDLSTQLSDFYKKVQDIFLYKPFPHIAILK